MKGLEKDYRAVRKGKILNEKVKVTSISMCFDLTEMEVLQNTRASLIEKYVNIMN